MPTMLGQAFPFIPLRAPPGMSTFDRRIYNEWLGLTDREPLNVFFNVRVGSGKPAVEEATDEERKMWFDVTAKRIDVLLEMETHVEIVEVRNQAQSSAIGRLQLYRQLYLLDPVLGDDVVMVLVTNNEDQEVAALAAATGVEYIVI